MKHALKKCFMLLLPVVFAGVFLTGCSGIPAGYSKENNANFPIQYYSAAEERFVGFFPLDIGYQFLELNDYNESPGLGEFHFSKTERFFTYRGELYRIVAAGGSFGFLSDNDYTITKQTGGETVGTFVDIPNLNGEVQREKCSYYAIFLDGNQLYYCFQKHFFREENVFIAKSWTFQKQQIAYSAPFEFYRFNLETGNNEEITLELFYEKIHAYDNAYQLTGN